MSVTTQPRISVLLPVRNEERHIERCLDGIFANDFPTQEMEVLVIDGQSSDGTRALVESYRERYPMIQLHDNPERLPYTALNIALQHARGDYIIRVDARSIIPKEYFRGCVETMERTGADNAGGVQRQFGEHLKQEAIALATSHPFGVGNAQFRIGHRSGFVDTVYLGCFRRELFTRIGAFDEDGPVVSEDSGLNRRIRDAGGRVYLNHELVVRYPAKESFGALARQYFIYGGAKAHIFLKYRKLTAWRQFVPLAFVAGLVVTAIGGFVWPWLWWLGGGVLALYVGTDLVVSLSLALKARQPALFPYLLAAFPCIHFPWPIGFLKRLTEGSHPGTHWRGN